MQYEVTDLTGGFPEQRLSYTKKGKLWGARCVNWGAERNVIDSLTVRQDVTHKQINYDLLNGKLHMGDLKLIFNPHAIKATYIPENIQHYPIMNTKLQILRGEELGRVFDYSMTITNPNSISEIEEQKKQFFLAKLQALIADSSLSEEDYQRKSEKLYKYMKYNYKDIREIRANAVITHYWKEYNLPILFNGGFMDGCAVGEEIYQCAIIKGEPCIFRLNPRKVRIYQNGFSNKIEDADLIVIEDYWSKGRIFDTFELSEKDAKYVEELNIDYTSGGTKENEYYPNEWVRLDTIGKVPFKPEDLFPQGLGELSTMPYDFEGNVRVCQVYWKSRRKILKVKSYDPVTGEEVFNLYPETYIVNKEMGETAEVLWINEAWQGTKIGEKLYVDVGPCPVQYNRLSNPSKCHFGIIGSIYNLNDDKPFSMVDIMKPYNYAYDVVYDRLNKLMARNHGKLIKFDMAKVPDGWGMDKYMSVLVTSGIAVENSMAEVKEGPNKGKLAASFNTNSSGVIDAELSQSIQASINTLEFIKQSMSEAVGITRQREGQIQNRETVGGVERATLQSSHITEWLFAIHDDIKKRVIECFFDMCKVAFKGRNIKFQFILPDGTQEIVDIPGDEFAECDYGVLVDNTRGSQEFKVNLPHIIEVGLQNQTLRLGNIMDLYNSNSMSEKRRIIETAEDEAMERAEKQQQMQLEAQQQAAAMEQQSKQMDMEMKERMNQRDNDTKILVASIQANAAKENNTGEMTPSERVKLDEKIREFDKTFELDRQRLELNKQKEKNNEEFRKKQLAKSSNN